jgi:hypothetical protein
VRGNTVSGDPQLLIRLSFLLLTLASGALTCRSGSAASAAPDGWQGLAPREELRPRLSFNARGGPSGEGSFVIRTGKLDGLDGHWSKMFRVKGGQWYRFHALRPA